MAWIIELLLFSILNFFTANSQIPTNKKKLIEFGWDFPKISLLKDSLSIMEQRTPFDGVVFSFDYDIFHAFDTAQLSDKYFQYEDLQKLHWSKFTDNFISVRGSGKTGPRWDSDADWRKITNNLTKLSMAINKSGAKGIGFDPEFYMENPALNPWKYDKNLYPNHSYLQIGKLVQKRGAQFMKALQVHKPDIRILCFWLLGLVTDQSKSIGLEHTGMALYPFFVAGMLEAKSKQSMIIDGNESSYWYRSPIHFIQSRQLQFTLSRNFLPIQLRQRFDSVSFAQSVFYDGIFALDKSFANDLSPSDRLKWFTDNLRSSLITSDEYVWLYSERVNWWKDNMAEMTARIRAIKDEVNRNQTITKTAITGSSISAESILNRENLFTYSYNVRTRLLTVRAPNVALKKVSVYVNSQLVKNIAYPTEFLRFYLDKRADKGNIIVVGWDKNSIPTIAYLN